MDTLVAVKLIAVFALCVAVFYGYKYVALARLRRKAAAQDAPSQYRLALHCYHVQKDEQQAKRLFQAAADQHYVPALNALAGLYNEGRLFAKDPQKAFTYYRQAAQTGDFEGRINLAVCYLQGIGTEKNEDLAREILEEAAAQKSPLAQTLLGNLYEKKADTQKALHYYLSAAQQGEPIAKKRIAQMQAEIMRAHQAANKRGEK